MMKNLTITFGLFLTTFIATAQTYRYLGPTGDTRSIDISVVGEMPKTTFYKQITEDEKRRMWPQGLQTRLDSLLADPLLEQTQLGLMVYDLTDDKPLYLHNERQLMRPASTMKLFTAITALDELGGKYQYRTESFLDGSITDGTLEGDIYCVGGFDPMFDDDDMTSFAKTMARKGIKRIQGRIITDKSMKDKEEKYGEGWCWDDKNPVLSPLLIERKDAFAMQLVKALRKERIDVKVTYKDGEVPEKTLTLLCSRKRYITEIMKDMMKDSDNLYAESMFYQIASAAHKNDKLLKEERQAGAKDAAKRITKLIDKVTTKPSGCNIADGSGLSLYNYVTPETEVMLLRYAYHNEQIYKYLLPTLPIAGVDGTLEKRMADTPAYNNVRAKTGTLTGIISLAGYCTASNGHKLCFSIINQGVMKGRPARNFQDKVCALMCDTYFQ